MILNVLGAKHHPDCDLHINGRFDFFFVIHFVASGSLYFQRGNERVLTTTQPLFFWTDRSSDYRYGPGESGSWDHHWISFQGTWADGYYEPLLSELAPSGYSAVHQAEQMKRSFLRLIEAVNSRGQSRSNLLHGLNRLLAEVHEDSQFIQSAMDPVNRIKAILDDAPEKNYSLEALSKTEGISYSHFRKTFRERFNESPYHYWIRQRMHRATQMLIHTDAAISRIGFELGYEDPARFSRVFKDHFGLSPRSYRASML